MHKRLFVALLALLALGAVAAVSAQDTGSTLGLPNARIDFPPPVYVVRGQVDIIGTANVDGQTSYFIEFRELSFDEGFLLTPLEGDDAPYFPATLPSRVPVTDGVLGTWDTRTTPDGIYELRLVINQRQGPPQTVVVAPVRVENEPNPFAPQDASATATGPFIVTATPGAQPTLFPTPTSVSSDVPAVTANRATNVRFGDSTDYPIVGSLQPGETAQILGRSSRGTAWVLIRKQDGSQGWVATNVVLVTGNLATVPFVAPPPLPFTPTPVASPTPNAPDLTLSGLRVDRILVQGQPFQIFVDVTNIGGVAAGANTLFCNIEPQNVEVSRRIDTLAPGQTRGEAFTTQINSGGGSDVTIICAVDFLNEVGEANEGNNSSQIRLQLGTPAP